MTVKQRIRWNCPNDRHPAVLGPTRPLKDSVIRYCLPCSTETGRLVLRVAPALERKRKAAATASAAKAKAKRERAAIVSKRKQREKTERYTVEDVDLREEFKRLIRLHAFGGKKGRLYRDPPEFVISRRSQYPASRLGYAEPGRNRITIATWPGQTLADARETLVHELTHIVVGAQPGSRTWHGSDFRLKMLHAFKEAYKVGPVGIPDNVYHGRYAAALQKWQVPTDWLSKEDC